MKETLVHSVSFALEKEIERNMAKDFAKTFYNSKAWKECRRSYIQSRITIDGGMCERCRSRLGYIVHHKVKLTAININDPDVALNACRLEYVCKDCHDDEHYKDIHGEAARVPRCTFDDMGNPVEKI